MLDRLLRIAQVSTRDVQGGAEKVAYELFQAFRTLGHESRLLVGYKRTSDPNVIPLPHEFTRRIWARFWWRQHRRLQPYYGRSAIARRLCRWSHALAEPRGWLDRRAGREDFHFPGVDHLALATGFQPDILHLHNLHGGYFDLRALPALCSAGPVFLTLHDAWMLSGHCAHSLDCERWRTGCGSCPDLTLYPAVRRDATDSNWRRKQEIFQRCRLRLATPCRWLMERVERSMLLPAVLERKVIPYGVDLEVFRPGDKVAARRKLGLDPDIRVLLFSANGIRRNPWKDYDTLRKALIRVGQELPERVVLLALGEDAPAERLGRAELRFEPFRAEPAEVVRFYQAADLYVHAAKVDTFPNAVLEALACGTPVVASAVGGIPEQVRPLVAFGSSSMGVSEPRSEQATGILVEPGNPERLAEAILYLVERPSLRDELAHNARQDAIRRFDHCRQVAEYIRWYESALCPPSSAATSHVEDRAPLPALA